MASQPQLEKFRSVITTEFKGTIFQILNRFSCMGLNIENLITTICIGVKRGMGPYLANDQGTLKEVYLLAVFLMPQMIY